MKVFIEPPFDRHQHLIFRETLDETIPQGHPVRAIDRVLSEADWSELFRRHPGGGRPAYRPDSMMKLLIYGYAMGFRSSRMLEYLCGNGLDFIWLMSGMKPDHDTIASFRKDNRSGLEELFAWTVRVCREAGLVTMERVAVDATRVEANNGRDGTMTQIEIEGKLKGLEERIDRILSEAEEVDGREDTLFGKGASPNEVAKDLLEAEKQKEKLEKALEKVKAKEQREWRRSSAGKRVPVTDPDADVMRDKKGGFAPNYNTWVAVDSEFGFVVSHGITSSHNDSGSLIPAIEEAEKNAGMPPAQIQADSAYATRENLAYCEERGIEPCIAPTHTSPDRPERKEAQPWPEDAPREAVHENGTVVNGGEIALDRNGKFDKSAFEYDHERDEYICPVGRRLKKGRTISSKRGCRQRTWYVCRDCADCPFKNVCCGPSGRRHVGRSVTEDVHLRHKHRMSDARMKADYRLRKQTVEPVIGIVKQTMGVRKFLLRGKEYVETEWCLISNAFNFRKLMKRPELTAIFLAALPA